ncbi:pre-rRNA-processing protein esf1 [Neophaeococcomyces mojaviensis]|uniref:Pre-rRNA-processing protein esf1 n=1 Tax=Neophaeococcomyces mojaviensis TaxID=3383035 RepID=A0ACC3AJA1_9EURO|nr:pre-rRNA-processing protein esf1 [Knufia sp. JES_112]
MSEPFAKRRKLTNDGGAQITDPRFANIQSDPRYRLPSKKQKIKLDKRFTKKFRDEDFTRRAKVDRYGRPIENDAEQRRLKEKFDLEDEDEESDEADDDDEVQQELARVEKRHDPLREGKDVSSSEDDTSTDEDSESEDEAVEDIGPAVQKEDVPLGDVSTRIAVVNLDWDNIRAEDLIAVFSSFLPSGGRILKVAVYPSEFGKERMEREEMEGPPKEIFTAQRLEQDDESGSESDDEEEDEEEIKASIIKPDDGSEFDTQALRQYQLERLRYFYAVLTFSSKDVAKHIYDAVDGTEYLSTANFFDLRFIPEDMDFTDDKPRDECDRLPVGYQPNNFVTDALQHSKVKLTWDAEDSSRKEAVARAFKGGQKEIDENDLKAYLGSDTSDDEDNQDQEMNDVDGVPVATATQSRKEAERQKMRTLFGLSAEPAKKSQSKAGPVGNIQVTFSSGLSGTVDEDKKRSVFENSPEPNETTVDKYVRKEKERKQKRKEKMKAARSGTIDTEADGNEDDTVVMQADVEDAGNLGFDDPFFAESLNDTKATSKVRKEQRLKKRQEREAEEAASAKQRAELELLMADDDNDSAQKTGVAGKGRVVHHFDMNEIEKAEKAKGKKNKFKSKKDRKAEAQPAVEDDFKMQTNDPRLAKLFESHEFAIDPTNSQLRQTKAMKEVMEESRRRKQQEGKERQRGSERQVEKVKKSKRDAAASNGVSEVRDLVAKIKRKST